MWSSMIRARRADIWPHILFVIRDRFVRYAWRYAASDEPYREEEYGKDKGEGEYDDRDHNISLDHWYRRVCAVFESTGRLV